MSTKSTHLSSSICTVDISKSPGAGRQCRLRVQQPWPAPWPVMTWTCDPSRWPQLCRSLLVAPLVTWFPIFFFWKLKARSFISSLNILLMAANGKDQPFKKGKRGVGKLCLTWIRQFPTKTLLTFDLTSWGRCGGWRRLSGGEGPEWWVMQPLSTTSGV